MASSSYGPCRGVRGTRDPAAAMTTVAQAAAPPQTWTVQVGSQSSDQAIQGMRFLPGDVTVDAGDTVRWVAEGRRSTPCGSRWVVARRPRCPSSTRAT